MHEYETLTGGLEYTTHLNKTNQKYAKINYLNILLGCYLLMKLGSTKSIEYLKKVGYDCNKITIENINKLRSRILSIKTRMEIEGILKKEMGIDDKKITYEEIIIGIEMSLNRTIDKNMTVSEYVQLVKAINKRNESLKNGRKD